MAESCRHLSGANRTTCCIRGTALFTNTNHWPMTRTRGPCATILMVHGSANQCTPTRPKCTSRNVEHPSKSNSKYKSVCRASDLGSQYDAYRRRNWGACSYRMGCAASGRCRSTGQTDGRTDGRTPERYIGSASHYFLRI